MRCLYDICEAVKTNQEVTVEELKYSVLAYSSLYNFSQMDRRKLLFENPSEFMRERMRNDTKYGTALNKDPKEWLGWENDFMNPDYQKFHKSGLRIFSKIMERVDKDK